MALSTDQVAAEIQNSMSFARSEANSAIGAAQALTASAMAVLTGYSPQYPEDPVTVSNSGMDQFTSILDLHRDFTVEEKPPGFPTIRTPQQIDLGALGDISTLDSTFDAMVPHLELPAFSYTVPSKLAPFNKTAPEVDPTISVPEVPAFEYEIPSPLTPFTETAPAVDSSITLPTIPAFEYEAPSPLAPFDRVAPDIDSTVDVSGLPTFEYTIPEPLTPFSGTVPDIDSTVTVPDAPTFTYPDLPSLLALNTDITLDALVIPDHNFTEPSYSNFLSDDFYATFATARTELPNYDQYGMELVNRFYPGVQAALASLLNRAQGVLDGTQTALTDNHDTHYYDALRSKIAAESDKALQALDENTLATGWNLPGAARAAGRKRIQQEASAALSNAALEVYVKRTDRELQHLQFVMQVVPPMQNAAVALFGQAWSMQMQAFDGAIQFADTAMKFATAVYQLKQRDYELAQSLVERQIAIFEALLKAELAKADITKVELEVEKLKSELNHDLIAQYTAQLSGEETKARVYASQIGALQQTIAARKLPLEVFLAQVQGFSALAEAKKSEYANLEALISGDRAKTSGKLDALRLTLEARKFPLETFLAEVQAFSALSDAKKAEYANLEARISSDKVKISSQLEALRLTLEARKIPLDVFMAEVQAYGAQVEAKKAEYSIVETQISGDKAKISSQLEALRLTLEARKIPLDVFLAEVQGFSALSEAKKAEYALVEAQISGDKAKTEGQLAKLQVYKTQADVFATEVAAQGKKIEGQIQRNQQILEEFRTRVQAEVQYSQIDAAISANALDAYKAQASVFLAETEVDLSRAKFEFQKAVEDARLEMENTRLSFERQFRALEMEITRVKATADITMGGADVHARIGQAAVSVMNTMASLSATSAA